MRYLDNPALNAVNVQSQMNDNYLFNRTSPEQLGRRLAQVINSYLLVGQVYQFAMQADSNFESNVTAAVEVGNLVEVYIVHWSWMALFFVSYAILLASGIVSVVFAHLAIGPEILGYASSAVRDSKYIELPQDVGKKEALEVTKMMGQKRLKYGFTDFSAGDGLAPVGIGLESEIGNINRRRVSK
ncbi:hypothetical protein ACHAPU_002823 [Fusarium lateritium]